MKLFIKRNYQREILYESFRNIYQVLNRAFLNLENLSDMARYSDFDDDIKLSAKLVKKSLKFSSIVQQCLENSVHKHGNGN